VVLLMGGLADMEVKAEVGEHEVVAVHVGDEAAVDIDAIPDKQFKGHVVAVGKKAQIKNPATDAEVTTFFVRVGLDVPPESALPGSRAPSHLDGHARQRGDDPHPGGHLARGEKREAEGRSARGRAGDGRRQGRPGQPGQRQGRPPTRRPPGSPSPQGGVRGGQGGVGRLREVQHRNRQPHRRGDSSPA